MNKQYYIYILTNKTNNVLYTGVTNNLEKRAYEHKFKLINGFTSKYNVNKLVYFEVFEDINDAKMNGINPELRRDRHQNGADNND